MAIISPHVQHTEESLSSTPLENLAPPFNCSPRTSHRSDGNSLKKFHPDPLHVRSI